MVTKTVSGAIQLFFKLTVATLVAFIFVGTGSLYSAQSDCWTKAERTGIFGHYDITQYERYGGGPLTEGRVADLAKGEMTIKDGYFSVRDTNLHDPLYRFRCDPALIEGEVTALTARRSNFYGFGADRQTIKLIDVYADKEATYPLHTLEVVGDEVWELYAGWLFKMKKAQ